MTATSPASDETGVSSSKSPCTGTEEKNEEVKKGSTGKRQTEESDSSAPEVTGETSNLGTQESSLSKSRSDEGDADAVGKDNKIANTSDSTPDVTPQRNGKFVPQWLPPPQISQSTILLLGSLIFGLAYIWPPLILVVTYAASLLFPRCYRTNDTGCARRRLFCQFVNGQLHSNADANNTPLGPPASYRDLHQHNSSDGIGVKEKYWVNPRGMCLCTAIMTPPPGTHTEAVVFFCHGYADHCSYMKRVEHTRLVQQGIAVVYIEYEGHGRSDGNLCWIDQWDVLVDDVATYFLETAQVPEFAKLPLFLMGESMGGAVVYSVYNRLPYLFRGVIFMSPMCKISQSMLPPAFVLDLLTWISKSQNPIVKWLGTLPLTPTDAKLGDLCYHVRHKRYTVDQCPTVFVRQPRLMTARLLLDVTQKISKTLADFDASFLILHGKDDKVTDPKLSQALFDESKSKDKTIRLYEGMWHSLIHGETDENVDKVLQDAIDWIKTRC